MDIKILTFRTFSFRNRSSSHSPTWMIFPSAGERITFSRDGIFLFGFLKKKAINNILKIPRKVNKFQPIAKKNAVNRAKGMRKESPSFAMGQCICFFNFPSPLTRSS
jgi:hypothetical protein